MLKPCAGYLERDLNVCHNLAEAVHCSGINSMRMLIPLEARGFPGIFLQKLIFLTILLC